MSARSLITLTGFQSNESILYGWFSLLRFFKKFYCLESKFHSVELMISGERSSISCAQQLVITTFDDFFYNGSSFNFSQNPRIFQDYSFNSPCVLLCCGSTLEPFPRRRSFFVFMFQIIKRLLNDQFFLFSFQIYLESRFDKLWMKTVNFVMNMFLSCANIWR